METIRPAGSGTPRPCLPLGLSLPSLHAKKGERHEAVQAVAELARPTFRDNGQDAVKPE
jgi:hypothetical protein